VGCLSHFRDVKIVLEPHYQAGMSLVNVSFSPENQGTLSTKGKECHLISDLQKQDFCATLPGKERKILSGQAVTLKSPSLQEIEILDKNLIIAACNQDRKTQGVSLWVPQVTWKLCRGQDFIPALS
jgi:hypothetical protein